jgi:hypothetical protein
MGSRRVRLCYGKLICLTKPGLNGVDDLDRLDQSSNDASLDCMRKEESEMSNATDRVGTCEWTATASTRRVGFDSVIDLTVKGYVRSRHLDTT